MTSEQAAADLRDEPFETIRELEHLVKDLALHMAEEHHVQLSEVVISAYQLKLLRFERYIHGVPVEQIKSETLEHVNGVRIFVSEFGEGCANCGGELC